MKLCGEFGGRTEEGKPCRRPVRTNGPCSMHAGPDPSTRARQAAFLAAYARNGGVIRSAKAARIGKNRHAEWLANDPEYAQRFEDAALEYKEGLEADADERARRGVTRLKFHRGKLIMIPLRDSEGNVLFDKDGEPRMVPYEERVYSDNLLMFRLKRLDPRYKDSFGPQEAERIGAETVAEKVREALGEMDQLHSEGEASRPSSPESSS